MNKIISPIGWDICLTEKTEGSVYSDFNPDTLQYKEFPIIKPGTIGKPETADIDSWANDINEMFDDIIVGIVESTKKGERYQITLNGLGSFLIQAIAEAPSDSAASKVANYINDCINRINAIRDRIAK